MKILVFAATLLVASMLSPSVSAAEKTVTLNVPGMNCAACPFIVSKALKRVDGVASVKASLKQRTAIVTYDDGRTDLAALMAATQNAGYEAHPAP